MDPGPVLFGAILAVVAGMWVWQRAAAARVAATRGSLAPELDGPLGSIVQGTTLLWFHSETCGPCRGMRPQVAALEARGLAHALVVGDHLDAVRAFGVMATPTTIRLVDGRIEAVRTGALSAAELTAMAEG